MVPPCAEWWGETDNWATTPQYHTLRRLSDHSISPCSTILHKCQTKQMPRRSKQLPLWRTGGDHQDTLIIRGWRLYSRTWNPITSSWKKQLTWLRIVHSGEWCLHLVLWTPSGACHKRREENKSTQETLTTMQENYCRVHKLGPWLTTTALCLVLTLTQHMAATEQLAWRHLVMTEASAVHVSSTCW